MIVHDLEQRSPDWYQLRVGKLTGSRAADMLATIKSGEAAARRNLRVQLVCERLTGVPQEDGYVSRDMQNGIDREADACAAYEALTGELAYPCGFVAHDTLPAGCSPDGQIGGFRGLLELKCPKAATHLGYLRGGVIPSDYRPQLLHGLWITGAEWCDFVSMSPSFPDPLRVFHRRLYAKDVDLAAYELTVRLFLDEVEREETAVRALAIAVGVPA